MGFRVFFCAFFLFRIVSYTEKPRRSLRIPGVHSSLLSFNYFRVTFAPSASSLALMSSASSLEAPSFRTFGAPSTTSLASFRPRPVASRTTLITLTLFGPTSVSSTSNSVFSSAASPAPAAAATTTPAAADTPNSSSQAFTARSALIRITL